VKKSRAAEIPLRNYTLLKRNMGRSILRTKGLDPLKPKGLGWGGDGDTMGEHRLKLVKKNGGGRQEKREQGEKNDRDKGAGGSGTGVGQKSRHGID